MDYVAEYGAFAARDDILDGGLFVLPQRGDRRVLQGTVGKLLDPKPVRVDTVPEELRVAGGGRADHEFGIEIGRHGRPGTVGWTELQHPPHHVGDCLFPSSSPTVQVMVCVMK